MKKLFCIIFLCFLISSLFYCRDFESFGGEILYVFEDYENGVIIDNFDYGNSVSKSMQIEECDISEFIDYFDMEILSTYYVDDVKVINGYSKYLEESVPYKNGYTNLQIAISDKVLVGYPQLYQGF